MDRELTIYRFNNVLHGQKEFISMLGEHHFDGHKTSLLAHLLPDGCMKGHKNSVVIFFIRN